MGPATAPTNEDRIRRWDDRYLAAGPSGVSWYQDRARVSLALMDALGCTPDTSVLDVGGGASTLVDDLLARGYGDVTVLDISPAALAAARLRLGDPPGVAWIAHDLLTWRPPCRWDLWHDRALLHFLVDEEDQGTYVSLLRRALRPDGAFVVGTFAEDGPTHCSDLPVRRYSADALAGLLGAADVVEQRREVHHTPGGATQPYTWIAGRIGRDTSRPPRT